MILKVNPSANGAHDNQSTDPGYIPEGWIEVPPHLEEAFIASSAFCELTIEDGVLVGITPLPVPEPEPVAPPEPTELERLRADVDFISAMTGVTL